MAVNEGSLYGSATSGAMTSMDDTQTNDRQERIQPQIAHNIPVGRLAQRPSMVGGRAVGEGDVGARQQEPGEIDTGARSSDDDCSGLSRRRRGGGGSGHRRL